MIFRNCAGGVVFCGDKVFLLRNEKEEWVLPKGVIRDKRLAQDVALDRVFKEAGIKAQIISPAGQTSYEFYSITRHQPVCNRITWYVMRADTLDYRIAFEQGFTDGDYFIEANFAVRSDFQFLDEKDIAFFNAILLSTRFNHCIHG